MDIRYVVRYPGMCHTPSLLAAALGRKTRRWPNKMEFTPSYERDFLFRMPAPQET
jgi:hypothetical protein